MEGSAWFLPTGLDEGKMINVFAVFVVLQQVADKRGPLRSGQPAEGFPEDFDSCLLCCCHVGNISHVGFLFNRRNRLAPDRVNVDGGWPSCRQAGPGLSHMPKIVPLIPGPEMI